MKTRPKHYTVNPYYVLYMDPASEDSGEECFCDPETGQCRCEIKYPAPEPEPDPPSPEPEPDWPEPQPEPQPYPDDTGQSPWKVFGDVFQAVFEKKLLDKLASSLLPPLPTPSPRQHIPIAAPPPIPQRPLTPLSPGSSQAVRDLAGQALSTIRQMQQVRLADEVEVQRQTAQGRPDLVAAMLQAYGPTRLPALPTLAHLQPTEFDTATRPANPTLQQAFANLVNPPSGANRLPIQPAPFLHNPASVQTPESLTARLHQRQTEAMLREQGRTNLALAAQQLETQRLQQQLLRNQLLASQQKQKVVLDPITYFDKANSQVRSLMQEVIEGKVLEPDDLKRFFHGLDLQYHGAETDLQRQQALQNTALLKQKLAANIAYGPHRLVTEDGYVAIGDEAFNSKTAYTEALDYLDYFQQHGETRPLKFPTDPDKLDWTRYDVTKQVKNLQMSILRQIAESPSYPMDVLFQIKNKFPNDGKWDTQGQYGLPGQVILRDHQGHIVFHENGFPKSKDQLAYFKGEKREAGYISNYLFGYISASVWLPRDFLQGIGHVDGAKGKIEKGHIPKRLEDIPQLLDGKDDQKAIKDGWNDYLIDYEKWRKQLDI